MHRDDSSVDSIRHTGYVVAVHDDRHTVDVAIDDSRETCQSCAAALLCHKPQGERNILSVSTPLASTLQPGDKVQLTGTAHMHRKAVALMFGLPCFALLAAMIICYILTSSQLASVCCGLAATLLTYIIIYALRYRLTTEFTFTVSV